MDDFRKHWQGGMEKKGERICSQYRIEEHVCKWGLCILVTQIILWKGKRAGALTHHLPTVII